MWVFFIVPNQHFLSRQDGLERAVVHFSHVLEGEQVLFTFVTSAADETHPARNFLVTAVNISCQFAIFKDLRDVMQAKILSIKLSTQKVSIVTTAFISKILNIPPTCTKYLWQETVPRASQMFLHRVQSTRRQESLAWHKYRSPFLKRLMHTRPLPAEGISKQVAGWLLVERQKFRVDDKDTGNLDLLN